MGKTNLLVHQLHRTLGKMEVALGSIGEAIVWTDLEGLIQWCNAAFDRLVGKPHISILGKPVKDILPLHIHGKSVSKNAHPMESLISHASLATQIFQYLKPDEVCYLEISGNRTMVSDKEEVLILSIRDVTELTASQKKLEDAKKNLEIQVKDRTKKLLRITELYKSILFEAVDAIITINQSGQIRSFNPAAEKIFGYKADQIIGKNVSILVPEPH